ncbi:MAG: T9SS type A sorting domain-containing protein [bacterium]|nr:T9SS type A sorting domain-containing protein [bacterium]
MRNTITGLFLVLILITSITFGQTLKESKSIKPKTLSNQVTGQEMNSSDFYSDFKNREIQVNRMYRPNLVPTDMAVANYDWMWNRAHPGIGLMYDFTGDGVLDPFMIATDNTILQPSGVRQRYATVAFKDDFGVSFYWPYGVDGTGIPIRTGWNSHVLLDKASGTAYLGIYDFLATDALIRDYIWEVDLLTDPGTATQIGDQTTALKGGWARFAMTSDGNFWELVDQETGVSKYFAVSTDGGLNFTVVDSAGSGDPNFWGTIDGNDHPVMANGEKISFFAEVTRGGSLSLLGYDAVGTSNPDSADGIYHWYSTNAGANWQGEYISLDGDTVISNRRHYEQNFSTWPFLWYTVDDNQVTHLVRAGLNTYAVFGPDTLNVPTIVYWNDRDKVWMDLERPIVESYPYDFTNLSVGNFNGPSQPTVGTSDNGNVVVVMWQLPQFTGEPGNSPINTFVQSGQANKYFYDIWYAYSDDGGVTWSDPAIAVNVVDEANYWVNIAVNGVEVDGGQATVHFFYYYDEIPGAGQLGENSFGTVCTWKYDSVSFPVTSVDGDDNAVVDNFVLDQNYPNPFNPSTTISYTLPERSDVALKVYDVLGNEVANLINTTQEAGKYDVTFDAGKLASGLYIYTLNAGNFISSKKMMLLK